MRKFAFAVAALVLGTTAAAAADLPMKAAPVPYVPDFSWTGAWVGTNFGGMWTSQNAFWPHQGALSFNHDASTGVGGLNAGFQYQFANNWVLGLELAWFTSFDDSQVTGSPGGGCPVAVLTCQAGVESVFTVGPRLGYAWHDVFFYGQGGYASGEINTRQVATFVPFGGTIDSFSKRHDGWFAGAGIDYAIWKGRQTSIIIGLDYKHVDLGTATMVSPADGVSFCALDCRNIKTSMDVVQATFSIKWDPISPLAPVVAKY